MKAMNFRALASLVVMTAAACLYAAPITSADVVVIGGTQAGVDAALAVKKAGVDVILLESRPALGSDTAGKLIIEKADGTLVTPLSIRKALDKKLLDAKIPFRTWVYVKDIIRDSNGAVAGVTTVSRSGERFIAAKCVIDATERAYAAKRAGSKFKSFPAGEYTVRRRVVSGDKPNGKEMEVKLIGETGVHKIGKPKIVPTVKEVVGKLWECSMKIKMKDGSALSYAKMEQESRDKTWTFKQIESAETCIVDAPDKLIEDASGVFTCGLLGRLNPAEAGASASSYARKASASSSRVEPPAPEKIATYECAVAGLGTGGASALVPLSRAGVKAIGFEYSYRSGGLTTEGLIGIYWYGNRVGFTAELDEALKNLGLIYSQTKEHFFRSRSKKATTVYGSFVYGVIKEGRNITALKVMLADGYPAVVPVKTVIDATGNCDVAVASGEKTEYITDSELSLQGAAFMRKKLGHSYLNLDWAFINDCDAEDLWYLSLRGRNTYEDSSENWDQSQVIDSRERRRLFGLYRVTPQDVMLNRTYPDIVCITRSNFDTHGQTIDPQFLIISTEHKPLQVNLPYRAILPRETDNLAVIGLGLSASRDAMPILRMIPDVQNQGWVAAKACEHSIREGKSLKDIDIKALQRALIRKKVLPSWVLDAKDNLPLSDDAIKTAVQEVGDNYKSLAAVFSDPKRAIPMMEEAYKSVQDEKIKLIYAHVLGMLGSKAGEKSLMSAIRGVDWDKGWEYRGMGQFGRPVSWIDSYIIALAKSKATEAAKDVATLAEKIDSKSEYSHIRAIAMYFESIGDKKYAPLLASKLSLPEISGNYFSWEKNGAPAIEDYNIYNFKSKKKELCRGAAAIPDGERSSCLKELALARALYRLGDKDGLARRTLEAYKNDPRRAYAEHARLILAK
jgi:ribulose 1,5-bisphosphate synthetase/thiazole synthase